MPAIRIMFVAAAALAGLALVAQRSPGAAPADKEQPLAVGRTVEWSADEHPQPIRYRAGGIDILLVPIRDADGMVAARATVSAPRRAPVIVEGERAGFSFPVRITILPWETGGEHFVLFESFTGGAHCCNAVQAAIPEAGGFRLVPLGHYDGDRLDRLPSDLDGDGRVDFVVRDDAFLYAFSSYADSFSPPRVLNIVDGKVADVSNRGSFRPLFADAVKDSREGCEKRLNGYCAAYAASASRAGTFGAAWKEVLRFHDRQARDWPSGCRSDPGEEECPQDKAIEYATYPEALKAFLADHGYIEI
jgi:hypothetical protein